MPLKNVFIMLFSKKFFQNYFKKIFYNLFKFAYGNIKGVIDPKNEDKNIEVIFVNKNNQAKYNIYKVKNARLYTDRINDTAIIKENNIIKGPSFQYREINKKIKNTDVENNIVFTKGTPRIKKRIKGKVLSLLTGGGGNENYWHWIYDVLPRIGIFQNIKKIEDIDFFLVPDNRRKFQKESLEILGISEKKQISSVNFRHIISDEIFITSHPIDLTENPTEDIQNIPIWICEWLKESFINNNNNSELKFSKKVFLDRSDSTSNSKNLRSIINEKEVKEFLLKEGFKIIKLGNENFKDQVSIFNNADIIVGLHGAGFANLSFCKPKTKIIELKNKTAGKVIENLAIKNDLDYRTLSFESAKFDNSNQFGHINVSLNFLKKTIDEFI